MSKSLGTASSIPRLPRTHGPQVPQRGVEAVPSDWRYWFMRAFRAWQKRSEQLTLFDA